MAPAATSVSERLSTAAMIIASLCALVVTVLLIRREFFPGQTAAADPWLEAFQPIANWEQLKVGGQVRGHESARVVLVEFSDFECPFCARFSNETLTALRNQYPDDLAIVYRHWPLANHRFAYPAARAAECAAVQGQFWPIHDLFFQKQDSLGLKSFASFGRDAGVADTTAYDACVSATEPVQVIEAGTADAKSLGAKGTPSVAINGYLLPSVPDSARLDGIVRSILAGETEWTNP